MTILTEESNKCGLTESAGDISIGNYSVACGDAIKLDAV